MAGNQVPVFIDGPYGRTNYYDQSRFVSILTFANACGGSFDCRTLVFVAGGIGITPFHSIITELAHRLERGSDVGKIAKVVLVWSCRSIGSKGI